ncbi:MAG: FtsW/RodA/SpoVE family cell cycle protein [Patescibacteria group bacterium]|nr:FtsW/RodA/SpoVE family cell cycle protein [Patescibacteria group bacterium]
MRIDYPLFILIIFLSLWGLYFFYGVSFQYHYFYKFLIFNFFLPFLMFFVGYFLDWRFLLRISKILFFISLFFLILPFFDFFKLDGQETARWFYFYGFSFQPSELIKLSTLLFFASILPLIKKNIEYFYISLVLIIVISLIIYFQPALSNLLIFLSIFIGGLMAINIKWENIFIIFILISIFILFAFFWSYRSERIISILKGDEVGLGFQLSQSRLAIGSGGLLGKGLGNSELKLIGLPLMITDNIFSIYAEETGFIGSILLIIFFVILILRVVYLGILSYDDSKKFFAFGLSCWLSIQIYIHLMANLAISTGIPLPFFSYGPSSQVAIMTALGIVSKFRK